MNDLVQTAQEGAAMSALREREHQLEIEVRTAQARLEEVRDLIGLLESKNRTRAPRKPRETGAAVGVKQPEMAEAAE